MNPTRRHCGIDLMRIVCMYFIVLYHIQGHGGLAYNTQLAVGNRVLIVALQSVYLAAVNGYALISGYVGYQAKHRYSALAALWLRVLFYSVGMSFAVWLVLPASISLSEIKNAFLPLLTGQYWYFTAYAGCFVLAPVIRAAVEHMTKEEGALSLFGILFVFSLLPYLLRNDPFLTSSGNHALWLTILYALGAYIRKHNLFDNISFKKLAVYFAGAAAVQMSAGFVLQKISLLLTGKATTLWYFVCHDSPTLLALSILMLALFTKVRLSISNPLFRRLTGASFSVYLIHDHPVIRRLIIIPLGAHLAALPAVLVIPCVLLSGMLIYLVCTVIDALRDRIFKLLRIENILASIETRARRSLVSDSHR